MNSRQNQLLDYENQFKSVFFIVSNWRESQQSIQNHFSDEKAEQNEEIKIKKRMAFFTAARKREVKYFSEIVAKTLSVARPKTKNYFIMNKLNIEINSQLV